MLPASCYHLAFRGGVSVDKEAVDRLVLHWARAETAVAPASAAQGRLVQALRETAMPAPDLLDTASGGASDEDRDAVATLLQRLLRLGFLQCAVHVGPRPFATLVPTSQPFSFPKEPHAGDGRYKLSRFAYCREDHGRILLETPRSRGRLILEDPRGMGMLWELATAKTAAELALGVGLGEELVQQYLALLDAGGMVSSQQPDGADAEEGNPALAPWRFHDLLFHAASRLGRHDHPYGSTYRLRGVHPPLPAVKEPPAGERTSLTAPSLEELVRTDAPFTRVLEERRSRRQHGVPPLTLSQLGEFLYRCARVRKLDPPEGGVNPFHQLSSRPYPGGGACYEFEIYPVVQVCRGLDPGVYYYQPLHHELIMLPVPEPARAELIAGARRSALLSSDPQVLFVITARFARVLWAYDSMGYALILKDLGGLVQTMYLVATAMGLAACALGTGNSDVCAAAFGLDYYSESSVGEFLLGSGA